MASVPIVTKVYQGDLFFFLKFSIYLIIKDKIPWVFMYFLYVFVTIKNSQFSTPWSSTFEHQIGGIQQPEAYLTCATLEYKCSCTPGTPFTKRMDVSPQFLRESRRCEIGGYNDRIILQLDRQLVYRQRGCISACQISEWPGDYKPGFETSWVFSPLRSIAADGFIAWRNKCLSVRLWNLANKSGVAALSVTKNCCMEAIYLT